MFSLLLFALLSGSFVFSNVGASILWAPWFIYGWQVFFLLLNSMNDMSSENVHVTWKDVESAKGPKCRQYKSIAKFLFFTGCP
jgi:hypothetical protein